MHDVIIIGSGAAGLSAAFWCDELGLDTLVLEERDAVGGQLSQIYNPIENYLGLSASNGQELLEHFTARLEDADFDLWTNVEIDRVDLKAREVSLVTGERLPAISLIIATGVRRRKLGIPGEDEFPGRGLIESGARDAELFAGKDVCVIGGGDAAAENALLLADHCPTVTLVHRGKKLSARPQFIELLKANHCLTVFKEATVQRLIGNDHLEAVEIKRQGALKPFQMAVGGVLIRIGVEPNTELFAKQLPLDSRGYIIAGRDHETEVANVFAIGDVANPLAPTISGATGAGATVAKVIGARLNAR
jgi:thioredoxin reductase (NADPH)